MGLDQEDLARRLEHWAAAQGLPAQVGGLAPMPGNAGLSFGFDLLEGGVVARSLVVRLAPPRVRRSGNTDVLRQVPLLGALQDEGLPVAPLVWWTGDERWFGTDVIVQERLPALPLHLSDPTAGVRPVGGDTGPYLRRAVDVLARVHGLDWRVRLAGWEQPRSVAQEVAFWAGLLGRHPEPAWTAAGERLAEALLATDPGDHRVGLFHGDYQTNNVLFDPGTGAVAAVVDWEIAGIGPTGLDLGWLAMMTDPTCWHPDRRDRMQVVADPDDLAAWYAAATGSPGPHPEWYEALACYRFGVIVGFNVRLHRTGRRVDPAYEQLASSVPVLFARGTELVH